eukprot:1136806-Pelagomonas_calceolata.AAC.5
MADNSTVARIDAIEWQNDLRLQLHGAAQECGQAGQAWLTTRPLHASMLLSHKMTGAAIARCRAGVRSSKSGTG